ncbi:MAG: PIN domain-containing protein [Actinomycetota bacterium]|nr:nucleotide-binding protein, PIN domain-containing protein [Acidimicrobiia bacterium]MDQ3470036.1 PIN domain-containing protein [Actinomycetota bacterium]
MRLVVDTSVLVGELLRTSGRDRLGDDRLELFLPEQMWNEVRIELPRRIAAFARRRGLDRSMSDELSSVGLDAIEANVIVLDAGIYTALEDEARLRSLRDPGDWPVVACALALSADIWTNDNDFLGTGVATWTTETLRRWLERSPTD